MKDALHLPTDAERAEREAPYRADLAALPDMAQMPEPEEREPYSLRDALREVDEEARSGAVVGYVAWAAAVSLALAWAAWEVVR